MTPMISATMSEIAIGACMLPGPSVLAAYAPVATPMINNTINAIGNTIPFAFFVS